MAEPGSKLSIVEIGGGTGTLARDVLDHVRSAAPQSYAECSYTSVEISPQLAQVQQHTVADTASHASHYEVLMDPHKQCIRSTIDWKDTCVMSSLDELQLIEHKSEKTLVNTCVMFLRLVPNK